MESVRQKEIVLLPFPFSDLENNKFRPALVVSNNLFNRKSADCIMVPLTSVLKHEPYSVLVSQKNLSTGFLLKHSRVRADKLFAVEKKIVSKKIGKLDDLKFGEIKSEIFKLF